MNDSSLIEDFTQDGLTLLDEAIDQISPEGCDSKGVNAIFRCLHTLKGSSGFIGLKSYSGFVHKFEDYIKQWQDYDKGLNDKEGSMIIEGLRLCQNALLKATDTSLPESEEYLTYLKSLDELQAATDISDIRGINDLFKKLKNELSPDKEEFFKKDIKKIGKSIEQLLDSVKIYNDELVLPVNHNDISSVIMYDTDITIHCKRIIQAFEEIAIKRKDAFKTLNIEDLNEGIEIIKGLTDSISNFFGWDVIADLCEFSTEVVEEAFRRFWTEGILPVSDVKLIDKKDKKNIKDVQEKEDQKIKKQEEKNYDKAEQKQQAPQEEYIRISSTILQQLTDSVGDLVADRNALENLIQEMGSHIPGQYKKYLLDNYLNLDGHVNEMERELSRLSNRQLNDVFRRLPAMVNNLCESLDKEVDLQITGGEIEIPRDLIKALNDPMVHIVRNSVDHGIESKQDRVLFGKPETGLLKINANRLDDRLQIHIEDDGKGLDPEEIKNKAIQKNLISPYDDLDESQILNLIFHAGFSTKEQATDISGRGVGMDVIRTAIESKGGKIILNSNKHQGTVLELQLPLADGKRTQDILLIKAGDNTYGVEYRCLKEILDSQRVDIHSYKDMLFFEYRNELIPFVNLENLFYDNAENNNQDLNSGRILVVEDEQNNMLACRVDQVFHKVKVVVLSFVHDFLKHNPIVRGTAILGTGEPYLIIDFRDVSIFNTN